MTFYGVLKASERPWRCFGDWRKSHHIFHLYCMFFHGHYLWRVTVSDASQFYSRMRDKIYRAWYSFQGKPVPSSHPWNCRRWSSVVPKVTRSFHWSHGKNTIAFEILRFRTNLEESDCERGQIINLSTFWWVLIRGLGFSRVSTFFSKDDHKNNKNLAV